MKAGLEKTQEAVGEFLANCILGPLTLLKLSGHKTVWSRIMLSEGLRILGK